MTRIPGYRALLGTFLLAAGCGELAHEDFLDEKEELEWEIRAACAAHGTPQYVSTEEALGSCAWFLPQAGQRCLNAMDATLDAVSETSPSEGASRTCAAWEAYENPLDVCARGRVTRRRRGVGCFFDSLTLGGRPIREAGRPVLAPVRMREDRTPHRAVRRIAARQWARAARFEHASIATFCFAAVELMNHGAPLALVRRYQEAALDEVRHAEQALRIAAALHGAPLELGALPAVNMTPRPLPAVALDALLEGCGGEGTAAIVARIGASRAEPDIAAVLGTIADEETTHAALAWATVRWAVERDSSILDTLLEAVDARLDAARPGATAPAERPLDRYGLLGVEETAAIGREVLEGIVRPVLRAMRRQRPRAVARGPHSATHRLREPAIAPRPPSV